MGCDVSILVERLSDRGVWELFDPRIVFVGRNYNLFGLLAGVRGEPQPIAARRGLPRDSEVFGCTDDYDLGDHSFTWYGMDELVANLSSFNQLYVRDLSSFQPHPDDEIRVLNFGALVGDNGRRSSRECRCFWYFDHYIGALWGSFERDSEYRLLFGFDG